MNFDLRNKLPKEFLNYKIEKIKIEASKKLLFRLSKGSKSFIFMDFSNYIDEYENYINVHSILSKIDISVPSIIEKNNQYKVLVSEDLGKLRYDKILGDYSLRDLLKNAVKTLTTIKNSIEFNSSFNLHQYKLSTFISEISEMIDYYLPYSELPFLEDLKKDFYNTWLESYREHDFDFTNFVHKDFNINNLIHIPTRKHHLKCGIIDFQSAFWGESCWDLFSLLEDSRIYFDDQFNEYFMEYYYINTNQQVTLEDFKSKYYFLNCSRQTRLLGRWVKLSKELNQKWYLKFIPITYRRLHESLIKLNNKKLLKFYSKIFPEINND